MLNYQTPDAFFEHCLSECGLKTLLPTQLTLNEVRSNRQTYQEVLHTLQDLRKGADTIFERGKPSDKNLSVEVWTQRWTDWSNARKAAFFSRAALFVLGDQSYAEYFVNTLRASYNIVFLGASSDALQHATGQYLEGPDEDLTQDKLADWWQNFLNLNLKQ